MQNYLMKRIILSLLAALFMLTAHADKIKHPALLFTPQRIEQAKIKVKQDARMSEAWNTIKKTADNLLLLQKPQLNKIDYLALSYLMTDEKKYADKIKEILLDVIEDETWGNKEMMARTPAWNATSEWRIRLFMRH